MKRHFSAITPQHAPSPRAAWQALASGRNTALVKVHSTMPGRNAIASARITSVAMVLGTSANRFALMRAARPEVRPGAGRAAIGWKTVAMVPQRSRIADFLLYQFISAEVDSDMVRYTA